jgi:hypothetical protein
MRRKYGVLPAGKRVSPGDAGRVDELRRTRLYRLLWNLFQVICISCLKDVVWSLDFYKVYLPALGLSTQVEIHQQS